MGAPLHFNTVSSTDVYYGVLLWVWVEVEPTNPPTHLPDPLVYTRLGGWEGGVESFSKYSELFPEEAELVGVE
jgi:hypothetical protein